ncbi:MAG: XRE family transcriptional regulator [Deltaproteobacteria bacterium]|nr:XRE family transcriptional regulator [Deltaproteobacteria bacterium]
MKTRPSDEFRDYLTDQLKDPEFAAVFEEEKGKIDLAIKILKVRQAAGLSQKDLAARIGTTQSVIARMENPEYAGYSIRMLRRIAAALGTRLSIDFEPIKSPSRSSHRGRSNPRGRAQA